jgi:2-polyprenyl-3-methyl-5-hydroxy-6-metoxy-1,4-benzoquinol methylase
VTDADYTRQYFSERAGRWLATAYGGEAHPVSYPVGARRVRLALEAVGAHLGASRGRLLDLGCGGGDLCVEASMLGFEATGIDIAEGMIAEADARRRSLAPAVARRLTFRVGDVRGADLPAAGFDAVTALGLIEYLEDDAAFFRATAQWLRPGGVVVVSCRNRLFNLASLNDYTRQELESGGAAGLLAELTALGPGPALPDRLEDLVARLREALPALEAALADDRADPAAPNGSGFAGPRRQHTPAELAAAAATAGFRQAGVLGVHPHPFPPALERVAPRFYNRLAAVFEALEAAPASLAWSSAFLGVFTR